MTHGENVEDVAVLVSRSPQILSLPLDGYEEFVQIPGAAHPVASAPQSPRVVEPEHLKPPTNRFIGHGDASFGEEVLDISRTLSQKRCERVRRFGIVAWGNTWVTT